MQSNISSSSAPITITLPNGATRTYDAPITGEELAHSISAGLAKAAIAVKVNGAQQDLYLHITQDAHVSILTAKDAEGLEIMRHTLTAQVLALALKELWPDTQLAIGPTIEHGFYYDVQMQHRLTPEDLPTIEARMNAILDRKLPVRRELMAFDDAIDFFIGRGENYKAAIIAEARIKNTGAQNSVSLYRQGSGDDAFVDLCYGPHAPSLGHLSRAFKLTKLAGAYWRGDANNTMLQRIYGVAFADKKALDAHLLMLEEAEKRDHRKLGRELDLFHFEDAAPGQPFWHHKGWVIYTTLLDFMRTKLRTRGYTEVNTPQMLDVSFWRYTGHWDKYRENMFVVNEADEGESGFALKPMSCPGNVQIYKASTRSYRDLPIRMAEFGKVFRNEPAGARHGLMRVQGFTQDDAHIFCTPEQLEDEVVAMCDLIRETYTQLGLTDVRIKLSTRPDQRIGSDEDWDKAEAALRHVCERIGMEWGTQ
jgi:threonyl-tRNA synthetase